MIIELKDLNKIYNYGKENAFQALCDVNLKIERGEMLAIMGTSGAGKSTLLHVIGFVDTFESGEYILDGKMVKNYSEKERAKLRNSHIGIVMQDFALIDNFTVQENVMIPVDFSPIKRKRKDRVRDALKLIGIEEIKNKLVSELSGGQKQRVAIARAIVNEPDIILADEPTGSLDSKTSDDIMNVFKLLNDIGKTIVIITHDLTVAKKCGRIVELSDGKII